MMASLFSNGLRNEGLYSVRIIHAISLLLSRASIGVCFQTFLYMLIQLLTFFQLVIKLGFTLIREVPTDSHTSFKLHCPQGQSQVCWTASNMTLLSIRLQRVISPVFRGGCLSEYPRHLVDGECFVFLTH